MTCYYPLEGWRSRRLNANGKRPIVFKREQGFEDMPVKVPCGQCVGCRLDRSRQWAIRCVHEASQHEDNCFVTLTYDDDHLPLDGSLNKAHYQNFMKRLRKSLAPHKVRYYHCGEYGDDNWRPHYHALLFGYRPPEQILYTKRDGNSLFLSPTLQRIWGKGFVSWGEVTFQSAAYVARYVMKKVNGENQDDYYWVANDVTGEMHQVEPEYSTMSHGIGRGWLDLYAEDAYNFDSVVVDGRVSQPPRYYDKLMEEQDPDLMRKLKHERQKAADAHKEDQTLDRLRAREKVAQARVHQLRRPV